MKRFCILYLFVFTCFVTLSQNPGIDMIVNVQDSRYSNQNSIPYDNYYQLLIGRLTDFNCNIIKPGSSSPDISPVVMNIVVDYLNFYESESGNLFAKGMFTVILKNSDINLNKEIKISVDNPYKDIKLKNRSNPKFIDQFKTIENQIQTQLCQRTADKIKPELEIISQNLAALTISAKSDESRKRSDPESTVVAIIKSDVDENIPENANVESNRYALIIGNEDYTSFQTDLSSEVNVEFAINDAKVFKEYCIRLFGIPNKQIKLLTNSTSGQMRQGLSWINNLAKIENGKAELIFYYSGHGLPDEETHEPYLIPVDISGDNITMGIKLSEVFDKLNEYPVQKVSIILDACFSGGARNQGLVAKKGVKIKPKDSLVTGNMVVLASSSGDESSGVYREKQHGYMTYFLLKGLKESKGEISMKALTDYVIESVKKETALNGKIQTPQVKFSQGVEKTWPEWQFK